MTEPARTATPNRLHADHDDGRDAAILGQDGFAPQRRNQSGPSQRVDRQSISVNGLDRGSRLSNVDQADATPQGDVVGRVIAMEPVYMERPDFDPYRFATRVLWLLLLVASPFLLLYGVLVSLGALPAILAFVGFLFLLKFITPSNLLSLFWMSRALNPLDRQDAQQIPVRYFRLRVADDESEAIIRIKGSYTLGNIAQDDLVSFWGKWRRGALMATRAFNHRTRAWVELQQSYSWIGLLGTVVIILVLIGFFYHPTAIVMQKIHTLSPSR